MKDHIAALQGPKAQLQELRGQMLILDKQDEPAAAAGFLDQSATDLYTTVHGNVPAWEYGLPGTCCLCAGPGRFWAGELG
jgi:hypothetical protein